MSRRLTKEELDLQFEQFLKESVSDDSVELGSKVPSVLDSLGKPPPPRAERQKTTPARPWWQDDDNDDFGLLGPGRTFRKSLRKSQPIQEEDEEKPLRRASGDEGGELGVAERSAVGFFSRDSLEPDDSVMASGPVDVASHSGLDTLEEEEEEERRRFFARLEGGANSTIDYSRLNRELESTGSTLTTLLRRTEVPEDLNEEENKLFKPCEPEKVSPGASADYSEDFDEDEVSERQKEPQEQRPNKPGMLAKVSLHDSLNSTDGALAPAEASAGSSEEEEEEEKQGGRREDGEAHTTEAPAGQSYGQSGASEVEALQEAYRQLSRSAEESEVKEQRSFLAAGGITSQTLSPADPFTSTLKPASTTDSELPTAEELMRPIGPDSSFARGFSLHPVSEVDQQEGVMRVQEGTQEEVVREPREKSPARVRPLDEEEEEERPVSATSHRRGIAEEVRRLMEEQGEEKTSRRQPPSNKAKARKRQPAWRPTIFAPKIPPAKSSPAQPAAKTPGTVRTGHTAKPPSPLVHRKHQNQEQPPSRIPILGQTQTITAADSKTSLRVSSDLVASVQSFASFLQQQMEASSDSLRKSLKVDTAHTPALPKPPEEAVDGGGGGAGAEGSGATLVMPTPAERSSQERLRLQLAQRERELHLREQELQEEHSREISSLKQENYLLHSKLRQAEEASQPGAQSTGQAGDRVSEEKLRHLEKEVREQETLLQGYHQENEKLYLQVKALQAQNKRNEEAMFTENQRLHHELAIARDKLSRNSVQRTVGVVGTSEEGYNVAELLAQVKTLERAEARLQEEARRLRQEKQALQVDLDIMKKERDLAKIQTLHTSGDLGFEMKVQEQRHQEEVAALRKRLQWYAENQELLDRDAGRLRAATSEVKVLTEQVDRLKSQVDSRASQQQRRIRERAADAKRIQDLERQVKEMEEILRRRHPNSLPSLMYAAAAAEAATAAGGAEEKEKAGGVAETPDRPERSPAPPTPKSTVLLQRRVHRLEAELENRDEDAKRSLRAIEQQFHKLQYEQRIGELQQQLSERHQTAQKTGGAEEGEEEEEEVASACVHSLQAEVRRLKEDQKQRESSLQAEVASLREQLGKAQQQQQQHLRSPGASTQRHQRQTEEAQVARVERLTGELAAKSLRLQELSHTVERLQRERRTMLSGRWAGVKGHGVKGHEAKGKSGAGAPCGAGAATKATMTTESFPATQDEKAYQPAVFAGSHISEVQAESDGLRERLEKLEQEMRQEREALQQAATHAQAELQRVKEHSAQQQALLSADHQRELESLRARHALEHSTSKVAELTNQVSSQEIIVRHLRDQLKELQGTKEALTVSKLREDTLQIQLTRLLEELKQAKEAHSPELRHFTSLESKIHNMELRYTEREKELQQVIAETRVATQAELQGELERWKRLAQSRSRELDAFRLELDAILDVLRELQRQGVVIPAPEHTRIPWSR
ncbi:centrosomal protein of 162 kDa isoform X3 [Alosa pseudoharengus]|uniref:centrosomal protein of 162 kDa isoform X3 n=1 Tax=Alosa pseudoharengus TaxID=34774 RepID=UPI003F8987FA